MRLQHRPAYAGRLLFHRCGTGLFNIFIAY